MLTTFIRSIVIYVIVLLVMRLMGKREIGQMQPFELAISIMIADLATIPMTDIGTPISNGIIPIMGLLVMHLLISILNIKSSRMRELLCGKPTILIYKGKIDEKKLKKERFTLNELEEKLRSNNIMNIGDVDYAILETSGDLSVIPKPNKRGTTPEDFDIMPDFEGINYNLIIDGRVMQENLKKIGKNYDWLKKQTNKFQMRPEEVLIFTINAKGDTYCHCYQGKGYTILNSDNNVCKEAWDARERGVIFDAANGVNNFSSYVARHAIADGFLPDTISSDNSAHSFNLGVHVKNLPFIMSKYLALGMNLYDVIRCTTENAAKTFNQEGKIGTLQAGAYADIAILKLVNKKQVFADSENSEESTVIGQQILVPQMTVINGMVAYRSNEL